MTDPRRSLVTFLPRGKPVTDGRSKRRRTMPTTETDTRMPASSPNPRPTVPAPEEPES